MVNHARGGRARRPEPARIGDICFVVLLIAVVGATAFSAVWHAEHDSDRRCIVCQLRHHQAVEMTEGLQVKPAESADLATRVSTLARMPAGPAPCVPARAPPLS